MKKGNKRSTRACTQSACGLISSKRSQLAIFVIIALIIVVGVALVFLLVKGPSLFANAADNPQAYIEDCAGKAAESALAKVLAHGGYISPAEPSVLYHNEKVAFLCYAQENEKLCTNREPMLIEKIEDEIKKEISPEIEKCFAELADSMAKYGYSAGATSLNIEIKPLQILIGIKKDIAFTKSGQDTKISTFDAKLKTALYDFARMTNEIINQEVDCDCGEETCDADITAMSIREGAFEATKPVYTNNAEEIYEIKEISSGKKFNFAVRNCARVP